jgi:hypothetical protein
LLNFGRGKALFWVFIRKEAGQLWHDSGNPRIDSKPLLAGLSNPQFEISTGSNRLLVDHG